MTNLVLSQDTTVSWFKNIDTLSYKIYFNEDKIPKECYAVIGIYKLKEIANPDKPVTLGCVGKEGVPRLKFNWIAKDNKNHIIISITSGGRGVFNHYYYFDKEKGKLNVNEIIFRHKLTFTETIYRINSKDYELEEDIELNSRDNKDDKN
ncbi:MAG: hypothetical protein ABI723_15725 [Bacteroidia bacterium]